MLRKFAAFDVLEATLAPMGTSALRTYAHRHAFKYSPRPGYLYVRSRAISSRTNDNFDTFPAEEIEKGYKTFIGKPVFVNHNNDNHRRARGVIIDAALHRDKNPDGSPDTWAEVLMEVDAVRFPKLAKAILAGHIDRTSMGTDVAYSLCSFCGNKASTPLEYCKHIPKMKGQRIYRTTASGKKEGVLVSEICHGLKFFENSLLVEEPADPTAFFTGVDDHSGMGKTASAACPECGGANDHFHISDEAHQQMMDAANAGKLHAEMHEQYQKTPVNTNEHAGLLHHMLTAHEGHDSLQHFTPEELHEEHDNDHHTWGSEEWPNAVNLDGHHFHEARKTASSPASSGRQSEKSVRDTDTCSTCGKSIYRVEGSAAGGWQHDIDGASGVPHQAFPKGKTAAAVYLSSLDFVDAAKEPSKSAQFLAENPPHSDHIVSHFLSATPEEHTAGMEWYSDAHRVAKALGHGDTAKAAGLIGVYSEGTPVAPNYHYASRALHHNTPVGGKDGVPGEVHHDFHGKPNATQSQADRARRMLDGEHHSKVLKSPKVSNYAHLIEHGDDEPGRTKPGRVVVDRHAVSAAIGRRVTDREFSSLDLSNHYDTHGDDGNMHYRQIADTYRHATERLREMGHDVKPHQVQAVAWLVQKRRNDAEDEHNMTQSAKAKGQIGGRQRSQERQRDAWERHYRDVHNDAHEPAHRRLHWGKKMVYLAFGEQKAPMDVDTLRDEECPVCGEHDSYDGNECQVCAYIAPPKMFQDPDLDLAKQMDLRKDIVNEQGADPNGDGFPDVIPGSEGMPGDAIPQNPEQVPDPQDVAQQQMNQIGDQQAPLQPEQLDANGQPVAQPDPMAQGLPQDPNAMPMDPTQDVANSGMPPEEMPLDTEGQPEAGTPGDAAADLICPVCGYQEGASPPQSVDMNSAGAPVSGAAGSLCPYCQQGQMVSLKDAQQMMTQQGAPAPQVQQVAALRATSVYL